MSSLLKTASWVIVNKETGAAVFETFQESVALKVNTDKYAVFPVLQYLQNLNSTLKG